MKIRTTGFARKILWILSGVILLLGAGCVVKDIGRTVEHTVKGDYFLTSKKFEQGEESFQREVQENPYSALANYYYGRFLLQNDNFNKALVHLEKARDLEPNSSDYHFWAGVAYGENNRHKEEEASYLEALQIDRNHLLSITFLGHMKLAKKQYTEALSYYERALDIWPGSPSALFNRALILNRFGRTPEEEIGWLEYLTRYPSGRLAPRAVTYLNKIGNFSFRNHQLGSNTVTLEKIRFSAFSDQLSEASNESLELVGSVFQDMDRGKLEIVMYQKNNKDLARKRALAIKKFLMNEYPGIAPKRIGVSWFAEPQVITFGNTKQTINESVSFFVSGLK